MVKVDNCIAFMVCLLGCLFSTFCLVLLCATLTEVSAFITMLVFLVMWVFVFVRLNDED